MKVRGKGLGEKKEARCLLLLPSCSWLLTNVSDQIPWHLVFDIMFWQVVGSAIDVIVISPRPGKFLTMDD